MKGAAVESGRLFLVLPMGVVETRPLCYCAAAVS